MRQARLEVVTAGEDWLISGDFSGALEAVRTAFVTSSSSESFEHRPAIEAEPLREQVGDLSLTLLSPAEGAVMYGHEIDVHGYLSLEGSSGAKAISVLEKRKLEAFPFVWPLTTKDPRARVWYSQDRPSIDQDGNINGKVRIGDPKHGSGEDFAIVLLVVPKGFVSTGQKFDNLTFPNLTVSHMRNVHRL